MDKTQASSYSHGDCILRSSVGKASACSAGDLGSIPGSGSSPGEGNGSPLQYSCLEIPMDRGTWQATVHGVARVGHDLALSFFISKDRRGLRGKLMISVVIHIVLLSYKMYPG